VSDSRVKQNVYSWICERVDELIDRITSTLINNAYSIEIVVNMNFKKCREAVREAVQEFLNSWNYILKKDPVEEASRICKGNSRCWEYYREYLTLQKKLFQEFINELNIDEIINSICSEEWRKTSTEIIKKTVRNYARDEDVVYEVSTTLHNFLKKRGFFKLF